MCKLLGDLLSVFRHGETERRLAWWSKSGSLIKIVIELYVDYMYFSLCVEGAV